MRAICSESDCEEQAASHGLCSPHYQKARYHKQLPEIQPRDCAECGTSFTPGKWAARYCSRKCVRKAQTRREKAARAESGGYHAEVCEGCGKDLPPDRRIDIRFCSDKCSQDARNARLAAERVAAKAALGRRCPVCDEPIAPERSGKVIYCSRTCKSRARRHEAYGLTREELRLLLAQHDRCAICQSPNWGKKGPQVDHCHVTGRVRGILCLNCNNGLGRFHDDPARLRAAADYLERSLA